MAHFSDLIESTTSIGVATGTSGATLPAIVITPTANAAAADILTITNAAYGQATTLTISDVGSATGTLVPQNSANFEQTKVCTITAGTTQTQGGATAITASIAYVTTGNASDGVILPALSAAKIGTQVTLINASVNAGVVYCPGATNTNTINGTAGATGVAYAASKTLFLVAVSATAWVSTLSN